MIRKDEMRPADESRQHPSRESAPAVLAEIREALAAISSRLDALETDSQPGRPAIAAVPRQIAGTHPSLEKYGVVEALADEIIGRTGGEKACTLEPGGRPCDHCSMCSSRGF